MYSTFYFIEIQGAVINVYSYSVTRCDLTVFLIHFSEHSVSLRCEGLLNDRFHIAEKNALGQLLF